MPYSEVWDTFHEMYESQVNYSEMAYYSFADIHPKIPPFNDQENIQLISTDIAILLKDWVEDARRSASLERQNMPVELLERTIAKYLEELSPSRKDTKVTFEDVRRQLRRYW